MKKSSTKNHLQGTYNVIVKKKLIFLAVENMVAVLLILVSINSINSSLLKTKTFVA